MKNLFIYIMMAAVSLTSCSDFLDVESSHSATEEQQWTSIEDTRSALMGVYALTRSALVENNTHWVLGDVRMGDFTIRQRKDLQAFRDNNLNPDIALVKNISDYRRFYAAINAAAVFIEKAKQTVAADKAYSEENLKWDVAQARALRAFLYFYLARAWGDVPLITHSYDNGAFPHIEPTAQAQVIDYAKSELLAVAPVLPIRYGSDYNLYYFQKPSYWAGQLVSKVSAYVLLAHISAYNGNYADAESYCDFVIDNYYTVADKRTSDDLLTDVANVTGKTGLFSSNASTLAGYRLLGFSFPYAENEASREGHLEDLTLAAPYSKNVYPDMYVSADSLARIFPSTLDSRCGIDTTTNTYNNSYVDMTGRYPIFKKVNLVIDGSDKAKGYDVFSSALVFSRIEDIVLLKAEAESALNRPQEAINLLNELRVSRGLSRVSYNRTFGGDHLKVINEVFAERRRELMGEGWRFFDRLRRQKLLKDDAAMQTLIDNGTLFLPKIK